MRESVLCVYVCVGERVREKREREKRERERERRERESSSCTSLSTIFSTISLRALVACTSLPSSSMIIPTQFVSR